MSNLPGSPSIPVSREQVIRELDAILASPSFKNSTRLSRFLRYIVEQSLEGRGENLKEYRIGIDVFERGETYDTRIDPVVRVEARQLRFKLANYYETAGAADEIVISLPKGRYAPSFEPRPEIAREPAGVLEEPSIPRTRGPWKRTAWLMAAAFAVFALVAFMVPMGETMLRWVKTNLGLGSSVAARNGKAPTAARHTSANAEALYMQGRYFWNKRTLESLNQAVDYFTQSIVSDPGYAPAYAGLADAYNLLSEYSVMPYSEAFTRAIAAAKKAVELDDSLANAHASLAFASFYGLWDSATAEREFKRALELNPNYVPAHHWYATFLMTVDRSREALAEIEIAQQQDPTSNAILADKGLILFHAGKWDQANSLLKQLAAAEPSFLSPHRYLMSVDLAVGKYSEYLSEYNTTVRLSHDPDGLEVVSAGQKGFAAGGARGMLQAMLKTQEKLSSKGRPWNFAMAQTCSLLGEKRKALEYLQAALDQKDPSMLVLLIEPSFKSLYGEPSFQTLLTHVGLRPVVRS